MGHAFSVRGMIGQWKTVVVALVGHRRDRRAAVHRGSCLVLDWKTVVVGAPPWVGASCRLSLCHKPPQRQGLDRLSVIGHPELVMQAFVWYPLTAIFMLKSREENQRAAPLIREGTCRLPRRPTNIPRERRTGPALVREKLPEAL